MMKCFLAVFVLIAGASSGWTATDVAIETELGTIRLRLDEQRAPRTTENFLRYVDAGFYDGGRFHRVVRDEKPTGTVRIAIVQAGIAPERRRGMFAPIQLEHTDATKLRHLEGTVSMARTKNPGSATCDFFICLKAEPELDFGGAGTGGGEGYAAFGQVVSGMEVVRQIYTSNAEGQRLLPVVAIKSAHRVPAPAP